MSFNHGWRPGWSLSDQDEHDVQDRAMGGQIGAPEMSLAELILALGQTRYERRRHGWSNAEGTALAETEHVLAAELRRRGVGSFF